MYRELLYAVPARVSVQNVNGNALIIGSGIAGLSAALSLSRLGFRVTIAERHPARRESGHFIRWLGAGTHAFRRFGLPQLENRADMTVKHTEIDISERRRFGVGLHEMPGTPDMVLRGDVESALYNAVHHSVDIRYGTTVQNIVDHGDAVSAELVTEAGTESITVDVLLGADGVRSQTRRDLFGPDSEFASETGHMIATWFVRDELHVVPSNEAPVLIEPGRAIWLFKYHNHDPCVLVAYETDNIPKDRVDGVEVALAREFADAKTGGMVQDILRSAETSDHVIFDSATHINVPHFTSGRVALIGDAAWSLTIFSGMGASLALGAGEYLGAALLATEGDIPAALALWEQNVRPFIDFHRNVSWAYLDFFTPSTRPIMRARKRMIRYNTHPLIAPWYRKLKRIDSRLFDGSLP